MTMEREIGETFDYKGVRLKVVNAPFCWDCYFKGFFPCLGKPHTKVTGHCEYLLRNDNKSVSFVRVNE